MQRALADFYPEYELIVHIDRPEQRFAALSELHAGSFAQVPTLGEDLQVDDIVYSMNRQRVTGAVRLRELLKGLHRGEPVAFRVERGGALHFVAMELP